MCVKHTRLHSGDAYYEFYLGCKFITLSQQVINSLNLYYCISQ